MNDVIFFTSKDEFSTWIETHGDHSEIWVGYFKKSTGHASLTWSDTVDVALMHGWIDGIRKTIDAQRYKIRFTPRKPNSIWSAVNVDKVNALIADGLMRPAGLALFNNRSDQAGYTAQDRNIPLSPAFEAEIMANAPAWAFLTALAPSYRRDSIWWVMSAKREDTRRKRFDILVASSAEGLKIPSLRKS